MGGLGLVHSLYRAHRAVVPATAWHLVDEVMTKSVASFFLDRRIYVQMNYVINRLQRHGIVYEQK